MEYAPKQRQMTKCDYVAEQLREKIISGEFKTGSQLPRESDLCEMFGVSRIAVREATKKLNMMGLVEIKQGRGSFVKGVDMGLFMKPLFQLINFDEIDVEAIYTAREVLEGGTAYLAAQNRTEEDVESLQQILISIIRYHEKQDFERLYAADEAFHEAVAKISGNAILLATLQALCEIDTACVKRFNKYLIEYDDCCTEHKAIFDAIAAGNAEEAKQAMICHTRRSKEALLA